jgi:hypothetical protein
LGFASRFMTGYGSAVKPSAPAWLDLERAAGVQGGGGDIQTPLLVEAVRPGWGRSTADNGWHWVGRPAGVPPPVVAREIRVLKPGEMVEYPVDLRDPAWDLVNGKGERKHFTELTNGGHAVRFVYQAPAPAALQGLPNAALVWQGGTAHPRLLGARRRLISITNV